MRGMGCVGALVVMFGDLGGCLALDRACAVQFWDWVERILGLGSVTERQRAICDNQMSRVKTHQSK